ncbi:MAG: cysteine synthase family protein [Palaeococcus sp.]|uniref:PLP-dependent cysteine synthase family protein n=1 Tax=Palaeococcus sp. (in: euryarchaeotes) TaxID=2820298 RepID=UPI0025FDD3F0|nr:cysteine synthase family protein [Palaeococcus sp. (in: euryarchaeotes)]MCD6558373.1 cysteine synthase family protein [Palaeococcus sp. (in: euryarchaeotes)]
MNDKVAKNSVELIGHTPIVRLSKVDKDYPFEIWAKCEFMNPTGSVKDRMAYYMIREAEKQGKLKPGMTIVIATTGNTGISFAAWGAYFGYDVLIVMPEEMSYERKLLDMLFGAKLIYTPGGESDAMGALKYSKQLEEENPDKYLALDQWSDEANFKAHYETTGKEIIEQLGAENISGFVTGVGSGGTLVGVAKRLKEANPKIITAGMEPAECPTAEGWFKSGELGTWGRHEVEGIGDGFVPGLIQKYRDYIDEWITVSSDDAIKMARKIARKEALGVGISSGANVAAAIKLAEKYSFDEGDKIVTILPDYAARYFSTRLFLKRRLTTEEHKKMLGLARKD